ncbi:hypothetical protein ACFU44_00685 [Nocardia rhizosphaerihabitans]|uniref:hypothetical protein n=1 Tax=Nocardia rhizosphaerihabitans TaxID=1691570 RepID=UPI00366C8811
MTDPFDNVPADEAQTAPAPAKAAPKKATTRAAAASMDEGKVTATVKGGAGFDDPWLVYHGSSPAEVKAMLEEAAEIGLPQATQDAAETFRGMKKAGTAAAAPKRPAQASSAPASKPGYQQPPANAPECPEGWEFRSGFNEQKGKAWKGFFPPRGSQEKPIFF